MLRRRKKGGRTVFRRRYTQLIRWPERVLKGVAWTIIVAYLSVTTINPAVAAVRNARIADEQRALEEASITPAEHYGRSLTNLKQLLSNAAKYPDNAALQSLADLNTQSLIAILDAQRESMNAWWKSQMDHMRSRHLAPEIIARQNKLEQTWREKDQQLQSKFDAVRAAVDAPSHAAAQDALRAFLTKEIPQKRANLVDHNNLPWQVLKANARKPIENADQLRAMLTKPHPELKPGSVSKTADTNKLDAHIGAKQELAPSQAVAAPAGLTTANPPTAADLAETIDAQFTADIKQKATDLGNNPVAIFNWVHDNVAFFPSYGSAQGAQDTFDKLSGNAFDQASLLIALLRSSGIPARYVYGTVNLPVDKVMNWVGGAQTVNVAQQILGQGGIPNVALTSGGVVKTIQIEHVWVEAFVNYNPSRGTKATPGDTWVPLDPSWKQYVMTRGMDIQDNVAFDAQGFSDAAQQGATVNQNDGSVQNLNQANMQTQFLAYQAQVKNYINGQNANATVADVLGTQQIKSQSLPYLPASTPYPIQTIAQRYSELPDNLRHHFDYQLYLPDAPYSDPLMDWNVPTVTIAGKKITMAWVAATQADAEAIASYLPAAHSDGSPIQPSELPTSLPASINVALQLRVEGTTVATGGAYSLGTELTGMGSFTTYADLTQYDQTQDSLIAGQQSALGVSIQGVSHRQLQVLQSRVAATAAQIAANSLTGLSNDAIAGDALAGNILGYLASVQSYGNAAQIENKMLDRPALSYGLFHAIAQPNKLYGIVTTGVAFKGVNMDVGHMRYIRWVTDDTDGNSALLRWTTYNIARGNYASVMESYIPEQSLSDRSNCSYVDNAQIVNPTLPPCQQAISAVRAIEIAAKSGQKIFTINSDNATVAIPQLQQSSSVVSEVQNAVAAGKIVTIHQSPINANGWSGAGYVEIDPGTGAGAYLIEGKGNGASFAKGVLGVVGLVLFFTGTAAVAPILLLILTILTIFLAFYSLLLNAIEILDTGGKCGALLASQYLEFFIPITIVATALGIFGGGKTVEALILKLVAIMYGADFYKGVAGATVCHQ